MPVSADRCCDWKKTASGSRQLGHSLLERGSWMKRRELRKSIMSAWVSLVDMCGGNNFYLDRKMKMKRNLVCFEDVVGFEK